MSGNGSGNSTSKAAKITREGIVTATAELLDSGVDLSTLTVRRIAASMDVGAMTLYSYFRSKDEILDAVADRVMGSIELPSECDRPEEAIRAVGLGFHRLMTDHPAVALILSSRVTRAQHSLGGVMEASLRCLISSGLTGETAVRCYGMLIQFALGFAAYRVPRPWGADAGAEGEEQRRQQQHFYAALPLTEFPHVVERAADLVMLPTEEQFEWSLEVIVRAIVGSTSQAHSAR